jgi:hypothetical protein
VKIPSKNQSLQKPLVSDAPKFYEFRGIFWGMQNPQKIHRIFWDIQTQSV